MSQEDKSAAGQELVPEAESDGECSDGRPVEGSEEEDEVYVERTQKDVLCGRGVQVLRHIGNLRLHLAANEYRVEYMRSRRSRKKEIIETIVGQLKSLGSRFLKTSTRNKKKWVEADDEFAYHKVSHVLRGLRTSKAFQAPPSDTQSSETTTQTVSQPKTGSADSSKSAMEDLPQNGGPQSSLVAASATQSLGAMLPQQNALQTQQNLSFLLANAQGSSRTAWNNRGMPLLNNNVLSQMPGQFQGAGSHPMMTAANGNADGRMLYAAGLQNNLLFQAQLPQIASLLAGSQNFAMSQGLNHHMHHHANGNMQSAPVMANPTTSGSNSHIPCQANLDTSENKNNNERQNTGGYQSKEYRGAHRSNHKT